MEPAPPENNTLGSLVSEQSQSQVYHIWRKIVNWFQHEDKGKWLENMRGMLSLVSTMITTVSFQAAINPPGGVLSASDTKVESLIQCLQDVDLNGLKRRPCAGEAVLSFIYPYRYHAFQICNTICFVASLSVTLLLVSGVPLNHTFPIWVLSIGKIVTISFLAFTYLNGILLVTPSVGGPWHRSETLYVRAITAWMVLVGFVSLFLTVRFLVWFVNKCIKLYKRRESIPSEKQRESIAPENMEIDNS